MNWPIFIIAPGTNVIQPAIDALPPGGGIVYLIGGSYTQTQEIHLGDGTATSQSTRHGVQIIGQAPPVMDLVNVIDTDSSVVINFQNGASTGNGFSLNRTQGWKLENLDIRGTVQGSVSCGIYCQSSCFGEGKNVKITGFRGGVYSTTYNAPLPNHDSWGNKWDNIVVNMVQGSALGIACQSGDDVSDTDFNEFSRIVIFPTDGVYTCMYLGFCDGNTFRDINFISSVAPSIPGIVFDYTAQNRGPMSNYFYALESGVHALINNGSTHPDSKNYIYGFSQANGGIIPNLPGLTVY